MNNAQRGLGRMTRRRGLTVLAAVIGLGALVAVFAVVAANDSRRTAPAARTQTSAFAQLTPTYPTESTTCGGYEYSVTTRAGTEPLAACDGNIRRVNVEIVTVDVGDSLLVTDPDSIATFTASPGGVLEQHGSTFTARAVGNVVITAHQAGCEPLPTEPVQPTTCTLVNVAVRP